MGKRIIQQARGKGSLTYRVRRKAYRYRIGYPGGKGKAIVLKLLNSPAHSAPLAKIKADSGVFYNLAFNGMLEGQEIQLGDVVEKGNIVMLMDLPMGTEIYNIETRPGDGGKLIRSSGSSGVVSKKIGDKISVLLPSKKEIVLNGKCRATVGVVAGAGRLDKPIVRAGKKYHMMKTKGKLYPRTSAVKMNAIDHPFGSGRGKRVKSKIAKRNAPPGRKVGLLRPKKTGKKR